MWFAIVAGAAFAAWRVTARIRALSQPVTTDLWMSSQWLAEHRTGRG
jgi:hypothetical protein